MSLPNNASSTFPRRWLFGGAQIHGEAVIFLFHVIKPAGDGGSQRCFPKRRGLARSRGVGVEMFGKQVTTQMHASRTCWRNSLPLPRMTFELMLLDWRQRSWIVRQMVDVAWTACHLRRRPSAERASLESKWCIGSLRPRVQQARLRARLRRMSASLPLPKCSSQLSPQRGRMI